MSAPTGNIPPNPPSQSEPIDIYEIYKITFDTWRQQVDSSWQRSSYFAAFEIAAIGGCWLLASSKDLLSTTAGVAFSIGGFLLTWVWYRSTVKMQDYVRHWWESILRIEQELPLRPFDFARQLEQRGRDEYRRLPTSIPLLFIFVWVLLFLVAIVRSVLFVKCACLPRM